MSGATPTGVLAFDAAALAAEQARQATNDKATAFYMNRQGAAPAAELLAAQKAADIQYNRTMLQAAVQNGLSTSCWLSALKELGFNS